MKIHSIAFSPQSIQISYQEERDHDEKTGVFEIRTLDVPHHVAPDEMKDLVDSAQAFIDAALLARRNPPDSFTAPR